MTERTTVRLPDDLLAAARRKALAERRTLTSLIEDGLRSVLAQSQRREKPARRLPRTSAGKGGLMPGIDLTKVSTLQEMDDLASLAALKRFG
ncbi:MAG TPA: hypothetical protein VM755_01670 [Stellaceae bacterium]|nr:hypothetical protein [Stellaceae bacterium]